MKVAHLWFVAPIYGGAETWALGLSKALKRLGVDSEMVCWAVDGGEPPEFVRVLGGDVVSTPDLVDSLLYGALMAERLGDYDLLCAHHMDVLFPAVFSKSLHGNLVANILHSPPMDWKLSEEGTVSYRRVSEKSQQIYSVWKMFLPYTDFYFTNSVWNQNLHEKYEGLSPVPLLGGVDHDVFKPDLALREEYRAKLKADDETILLFYSSAAGRRKRHEILLKGVKALTSQGLKVKCILTCSKDRRSQSLHPLVRRIVESLGIQDSVHAFPATGLNALLGLYNACDVYVHPANNEHLGMAIMEAMAVGKPVVAQNNGGVPELVKDNEQGFLFKTDSIDNMVDRIRRLSLDTELRNAMSQSALRRSRDFEWMDVARRFLEVVS